MTNIQLKFEGKILMVQKLLHSQGITHSLLKTASPGVHQIGTYRRSLGPDIHHRCQWEQLH